VLNPLRHPLVMSRPRYLSAVGAWHQHVPFAMLIVDLVRPNVLVELGTHYGDSYCTFLQAVSELGLSTRCYAIDTWQGDPQAGGYGPEVFATLQAYHDPLYGAFSRLVQSTFDDARKYFSDGSIDLLHIDGYHTYEIVRHDFETWLPKMSACGVVLLHDINVRERDFGVWRLWEEVSTRWPSFAFAHGHGLGVLGVGTEAQLALAPLFNASQEETTRLRTLYAQLGHRIASEGERREVHNLRAGCSRLTELAAQREREVDTATCAIEELTRARADDGEALEAVTRELESVRAMVQRQGVELAALENLKKQQFDFEELQVELESRRLEVERERCAVVTIGRERDEARRAARDMAQGAAAVEGKMSRQQRALIERETELARIRSSLAYRTAATWWRACDRLLRPGTRRRSTFDRVWRLLHR
jgi:hypothetical protein